MQALEADLAIKTKALEASHADLDTKAKALTELQADTKRKSTQIKQLEAQVKQQDSQIKQFETQKEQDQQENQTLRSGRVGLASEYRVSLHGCYRSTVIRLLFHCSMSSDCV